MVVKGTEEPLGAKLLAFCSTAAHELVLIAPFIKVSVFTKLLSVVSPKVHVTCVTRWRPEEVAGGVTDLEVFDEAQSRDNTCLLLLPQLHAKYFRADERCLVGSANLTGRALGWRFPSNVELLIEQTYAIPQLVYFEKRIIENAFPATEEHKHLVGIAASRIETNHNLVVTPGDPSVSPSDTTVLIASSVSDSAVEQLWLPSLRQPQDLYLAYSGRIDQLSSASRIAAAKDLAAIDQVAGLDRASFEAAVGAVILQMPMISTIDQALVKPQRFGALRDLIAAKLGASSTESSSMWQTTMRWLMFFLPHRYERRVPAHSEIFGRSQRTELAEK